jgi:O-antigen/teichoic acid export membrane protein
VPSTTLKAKVMSAMGWSLALRTGFQLVSWCITLVVIHKLSPRDYGLMAMAQVFTSFMLGFSSLGLGDALIQREHPPPSLVASTFGVLLAMAAALTAGLAAAAPPIAAWFGDPRLVPLIQLSSLGFLFDAFTMLPRMFLMKALRLRPVVIADLASGLAGSLVTLALAYSGHGVWSLMDGWLAMNITRQIIFLAAASEFYVWPRFDVAAVRPLLGYGAYSTLEYVAWNVMTSADVLIVGRILGAADLGLYTVVINFAAMPLNKIAPIINGIAFPAFAQIQAHPAQARQYVLKALRLMPLLVVPLFLGIGVTAPEIVNLVFGPQWQAARPLLAILSAALIFRAMLVVVPNYLQGIGDAKAAFWCTAVGAVTFPLAILAGTAWGITGACYAWLFAYPAVFATEAAIAAHRASLPLAQVLAAPLRPLAAGCAMVAAVLALRLAVPLSWPGWGKLACFAALGASVYGLVIMLAFPALARELRGLMARKESTSF